MQKNSPYLLLISLLFLSTKLFAQDSTNLKTLNDVIVTGQYQPQSLKNSVYSVKVINNQRIKQSGAVNVQQVLNTQLGIRFSNDAILGANVSLNGLGFRNVKILLDGVPLLDRSDERTSLNQIDINTIERVEIVEGPMSVSYGTDAMAGVINLITKKSNLNKLWVSAKAQEETAGNEYYPFSYKGVHTQTLSAGIRRNNWDLSGGGSHIDFSGFGGDNYGRGKSWLPKEQWLGNGRIGYSKNNFNIYYRLDGMKEMITDRNKINIDLDAPFAKTTDQSFRTDRFLHQLQANYRFKSDLELSTILSYTDLKRTTKTVNKDFVTHVYTLGTGDGEQDVSKLKSFTYKNTLQWTISPKLALQPGTDISYEKATGDRIVGTPSITDYAFFASAEYKPTTKISIRPGLRFEKNSVYDAPPVIPSLNTKFALTKDLDLRLAYGYGFRAPVLRELFFRFKDVNHDIIGNPNLKAEYSNSVNGSLAWSIPGFKQLNYSITVGGFYSAFRNQIELLQKGNTTQYTYFNANRSKALGFNIENRVTRKNLDVAVGFNYNAIGKTYDENVYKNDDRDILWTPEINTNVIYRINKLKSTIGLFYKFVGDRKDFSYETNSGQIGYYLTNTDSYNLADLTVTTAVYKYFTLSAGVKNLFDVTNVKNTTLVTSSVSHSNGGAQSIGYGRSFFLGLNFDWHKK